MASRTNDITPQAGSQRRQLFLGKVADQQSEPVERSLYDKGVSVWKHDSALHEIYGTQTTHLHEVYYFKALDGRLLLFKWI